MSAGATSIPPAEGCAAAAVRSSSATRRPASTTEYPAACKARLAARPMPLPAPVTSAILSSFAIVSPFFWNPFKANVSSGAAVWAEIQIHADNQGPVVAILGQP